MIYPILLSLLGLGLIVLGLLSKIPLRRAEGVVGGIAVLILVAAVRFWGWTPPVMISIILIGGVASLIYTHWKLGRVWREDPAQFRKLRQSSLVGIGVGLLISIVSVVGQLAGFENALTFCVMGLVYFAFALWEYFTIRQLEGRKPAAETLPRSATG